MPLCGVAAAPPARRTGAHHQLLPAVPLQTIAEHCPCLEALSLAHCTQFSDSGVTAQLGRMLLRPAAPDGSSAPLRRLDLSFTQVCGYGGLCVEWHAALLRAVVGAAAGSGDIMGSHP